MGVGNLPCVRVVRRRHRRDPTQAQSWFAECDFGMMLQDMRERMTAAGDHVCMTIEKPRMIAVQPPTAICPEPSPLHIYLLPYPRIQIYHPLQGQKLPVSLDTLNIRHQRSSFSARIPLYPTHGVLKKQSPNRLLMKLPMPFPLPP